MSDELKEVKYFKEITDFKSPYNLKYFIEMKLSKSRAEPYLKIKGASTMELFC